jgi:hypothetical protein
MLVASIPYKFSVPWGASATSSYINTIPVTSVSPLASQTLGFPPATSRPSGAGGTPPDIGDFNGALNYATLWTQWVQAGAPVGYDSAFSTAIGGYPNGAILASATFGQRWISTVDNNTSNPDAGGANWRDLFWNGAASLNAGTAGGTANAITLTIPGVTSYAQLTGIPISFTAAYINTATTAININGMGWQTIYQGGTTLSGGEIGGTWLCTVTTGGVGFILVASGSGAINVRPATASTHALQNGQAQADFAALAGSSSQVFNVANAATATEAVALGQLNAEISRASSEEGYLQGQINALFSVSVGESRALNTTFTNSYGRPMFLSGWIATTTTFSNTLVYVNGSPIYSQGTANTGAVTGFLAMVPTGATYQVANTGGGTLIEWAETY